MFERILVLAGSDEQRHPALRRALHATDSGAQIEVFDVVYEPLLDGYLGNKAVYEGLRERVLRERLERCAALARAAEGSGVRSVANVVWGHPFHTAVANEVRTKGIDLVVTAPLLAGPGGTLSHSDWQLVLSCPAPVLLVRSTGDAAYRTIAAAVDPMHAHAKPENLDAAILHNARLFQRLTGAALTAVHCYPPPSYFGAALPDVDDVQQDARRQALRQLLEAAGLETGAGRLVEGHPHTVLQSLADAGEADLLVMGALARGRLKDLVLGNTAERVLQHGTSDVLLIKPPAS